MVLHHSHLPLPSPWLFILAIHCVAITAPAEATFVPMWNDDERRAVLEIAVQASAIVCTGRLDSRPGGDYSPRYEILVADVIKGTVHSGDTLAAVFTGPPETRILGDTVVCYLVSCPEDGLFQFHWALTDIVRGDSVDVYNPPRTESWNTFRGFLARTAIEAELDSVKAQSDLIVSGVVDSVYGGETWYDRVAVVKTHDRIAGVNTHVAFDSIRTNTPEATGAHITVHHRRPPIPALFDPAAGDDVLLFLKRHASGEWATHGGVFGVWRVTNGVAAAAVRTSGCVDTIAYPVVDLEE